MGLFVSERVINERAYPGNCAVAAGSDVAATAAAVAIEPLRGFRVQSLPGLPAAWKHRFDLRF